MHQTQLRAPCSFATTCSPVVKAKHRKTALAGFVRRQVTASASTTTAVGALSLCHYTELKFQTKPGIHIVDITPEIRAEVEKLGMTEGFVNILSRHTTTAITINESEPRLLDDIRQFLYKLAPPSEPYLHNDLHYREAPFNWPGGWEAWAQQEPQNAHSHLLSMVLGNSETVPVTKGKLALGTWQSVMLVELDGARLRTVGLQVVGMQQAGSS